MVPNSWSHQNVPPCEWYSLLYTHRKGMKLLIRRDFLLFCFVWGAGKEVVNFGPEWNNRTLWQGRNESKEEKTTLVFLLSPPFQITLGDEAVFFLKLHGGDLLYFPFRMILADCMASKYASGRFFLSSGREKKITSNPCSRVYIIFQQALALASS